VSFSLNIRETPSYLAQLSRRGVRIIAKEKGACPKMRVVSNKVYAQLETMSDREFDGAVCLLGIGTKRK
jgi:hypothetical protein